MSESQLSEAFNFPRMNMLWSVLVSKSGHHKVHLLANDTCGLSFRVKLRCNVLYRARGPCHLEMFMNNNAYVWSRALTLNFTSPHDFKLAISILDPPVSPPPELDVQGGSVLAL